MSTTTTIGQTSDGYHTFDELYEHRHALFLCLLSCHAGIFPMWMSKRHDDGTEMPGWFVAGIALPEGTAAHRWLIALPNGMATPPPTSSLD